MTQQYQAIVPSGTARLRAMRQWGVEALRRLYLVVLVVAMFGTLLLATILLRLAIWLPLYYWK